RAHARFFANEPYPKLIVQRWATCTLLDGHGRLRCGGAAADGTSAARSLRPVPMHHVSALVLATLLLGAVPVAHGQAQDDCVPIADLSRDPVGAFPADWKVRKDEGKSIYSVREEDGKHVLHAASKGQGIQAAFEHEWDLDTYPILAWSWRPIVFPAGA